MAIPAAAGRPMDAGAAAAGGTRHTRRFLVALYALALLWGARQIYFWEPSWLDVLLPIAFAILLGWWAVADSRERRHPIPMLSRPWFFLAAGFLVPGYVLWSRRWAGLGWLVLHSIVWCLIATIVMHAGGLLVFGRAWTRALGL